MTPIASAMSMTVCSRRRPCDIPAGGGIPFRPLQTGRRASVAATPVEVGIVGLGRWAKVLTRASLASDALRIVAGYSRSEASRAAFAQEFGIAVVPDLATMLADPAIRGVILTVPNEQHLPIARAGRAGRQARLHGEADRQHARGGPGDRGAGADPRGERHGRPQRPPDGRHPRHPRRHRCRRARPRRLHRGQFLQRARARAHAQDLALVQGQGAGRAALAARHPPVRRAALSGRRDRRGERDGLQALAGRRRGRRPVDDPAEVRRRQGRLCRLLLDLAGNFRRAGVRLEGPHALRDRLRHLGHARASCTRPRRSTSSAARTATASASSCRFPRATCSAPSSTCSPKAAAPAKPSELNARNGNVAVAVVYAALRSIEKHGQAVRIADVIAEAHGRLAERSRDVA